MERRAPDEGLMFLSFACFEIRAMPASLHVATFSAQRQARRQYATMIR